MGKSAPGHACVKSAMGDVIHLDMQFACLLYSCLCLTQRQSCNGTLKPRLMAAGQPVYDQGYQSVFCCKTALTQIWTAGHRQWRCFAAGCAGNRSQHGAAGLVSQSADCDKVHIGLSCMCKRSCPEYTYALEDQGDSCACRPSCQSCSFC